MTLLITYNDFVKSTNYLDMLFAIIFDELYAGSTLYSPLCSLGTTKGEGFRFRHFNYFVMLNCWFQH